MEQCGFCGKEFANKSGLTGHLRFSHPDTSLVAGRELLELRDEISNLKNLIGGKSMDELVTQKDLSIRDLKAELVEIKKAKHSFSPEELRQHLAECAACRRAATDLMSDDELTEIAEARGLVPNKIVIKAGGKAADMAQACGKCGKPMSQHHVINDLVFGQSVRCPGKLC